MRPPIRALAVLVLFLGLAGRAVGAAAEDGPFDVARWIETHWLTPARTPTIETLRALPFSLRVDDRPFAEVATNWTWTSSARALDSNRTEHVVVAIDPSGGLGLRGVGIAYRDFPVFEWTLTFTNGAAGRSPLLSGIQAIDVGFERGARGEFTLHHLAGDNCTPDSYAPGRTELKPGTVTRFGSAGGRPTTGGFPYFNVEDPAGRGAIVVLGWPGQWQAQFERDPARGLRVRAGQEGTHFRLEPGETARTPLGVLLGWQGDWLGAQNLWRRWMIAHNLPRDAAAQSPAPMLTSCSGGFFPGLKCNEGDEVRFIDTYLRERIPLDYWWMDAGWYPCGEGWPQVGTWEPDAARFPRGLRAVADHVHARKVRLIVWFEPERVTPGTWLATQHPEWLLGRDGDTRLLNLGHPAARAWLTEHVSGLLTSQGIDLYRQDFNLDPLPYWRGNDSPERQGLTEIHHVEGYLAYWDELRRRHPGLLIDSCASGGRRNDLETLRRAVPLLRSDYQSFAGDPAYATGNQGHTYGLSLWLPYFGQGVYYNPTLLRYNTRSHFGPAFGFCADVRQPGIDWEAFRGVVAEWREVAPMFRGDFHPLTPYTLDESAWMAWQFHRSDAGEGCVQAFRRPQSPFESVRLPLRGLEPSARYEVRWLDGAGTAERLMATGRELASPGLRIVLDRAPDSAVVVYRRIAP